MNTETYDETIKKAQQELDRIKALADQFISEFKQAIHPYLTSFANQIVSNAVKEKPDIIASLAPEKLRELKNAIAEVIAFYPTEINRRLDNIAWAHRNEPSYFPPETLSHNTFKLIDTEIRILLGQVGSLLIAYRLAAIGMQWKTNGVSSQTYYYVPSLADNNDKSLLEFQKQYALILKDFVKANNDLKQAELDKKAAEAKSIWDNA